VRTSAHGLSIDAPHGWEVRILRRAGGSPFLHVASFSLDADAGEFGASATARMGRDAAFAALVEYPDDGMITPGAGLFAGRWSPRLRAAEFASSQLQVTRPGHLGLQRFFTASDRAFCLYAVISPIRRRPAQLSAGLSAVLATLRIQPGR
jgi:hypothetical protein